MVSATVTGWLWLLTGVVIGSVASLPLKWSQGFTHVWMGLAGVALSMVAVGCWTIALRTIPFGIGFFVWEGLASCAATVISVMVFHEKLTSTIIGFSLLILLGCAGLAITSKQA